MTYATTADLANALPPGLLAQISTDQQNAALDSASSVVDSYLRSRFILPLVSYGAELTQATAQLAVWDLLASRGMAPDGASYEVIRNRRDDVVRWLERIASNLATPEVVDSSVNGAADAPRVLTSPARGW